MNHTPPAIPAETLDSCRAHIQALYASHPQIRLSITLTHAKVVEGAPATIVGVYRHCFCVEETSCGVPQRHTFTFADLLTHRVSILPAD